MKYSNGVATRLTGKDGRQVTLLGEYPPFIVDIGQVGTLGMIHRHFESMEEIEKTFEKLRIIIENKGNL